MTLVRRIASPIILLAGFALLAAGLYRTFVTFSIGAVQWPLVVLGAAGLVIGILVQAATLSRRLTGAALMLVAAALFGLGYPLFGIFDVPNLSWLWIPATALAAAAIIVGRGRAVRTLLAAVGLAIVYVGIGLFVGQGPVGWWPVSIQLPRDLATWVSVTLGGYWPVQVVLMSVLVALTVLGAAAIDPGRSEKKPSGDGRISG